MQENEPTQQEPKEPLEDIVLPPPVPPWAKRLAERAEADSLLKATPRGLVIALTVHALIRGSNIGTLSQTPQAMLDHIADVAIDMADAIQRAQERRASKPA